MHHARLSTVLALCLAAGPALADDSDIRGMKRSDPGLQCPAAENPELKPFMTTPPAAATRPPAPAAALAPPPVAAPVQRAAFGDLDVLLRQAEANLAAKRMKQADAELARARSELLDAKAAGEPVPQDAMAPLAEARDALKHGHAAAAERATRSAERVIGLAR